MRARVMLAAALALWLILTVLFVVTYPLNTAADAMNYALMVLHLKSNLMHASGYPFVVGHLLRLIDPLPASAAAALWDPTGPVHPGHVATLLKILVIQHAVHAAVVVACALLLLRTFGPLVAVAVVVFWGMSTTFMSTVSTTFPEWLQGDVLLLTACLCAVGLSCDSNRRKVLAYLAAGGFFGLAFVIKYNSLVFGPIFLTLLLFETMPWRLRWLTALGCAAAFALVTGVHLFSFHYPSTRAVTFNYDGGWVLMARLESAFGNDAIERSSAINTLRYRALARAIPPDYKFAHAFWNLDDVAPADVRAPYRVVYDRIMTMPAAELVEFIDRHPRPASFQLWLSPIPLYHYIGLEEANALATNVYLEFVRDNPLRFAAEVARSAAVTTISGKAWLLVPLHPPAAGLRPTTALASAYIEYLPAPRQSPVTLRYWSPRLLLWQPGLRLFRAVHAWRPRPHLERAAYLVLLAGIVFRRTDRQKRFITAILLALACYVVASNAVVSFRPKEATAAWPIACLLWAVAIKWSVELLSAALARFALGTTNEAAVALGVLLAALPASASGETRKVVAGPQYAKSGLHQTLFGADYRALWTTPATFEVLDLQREAGGLTPAFRVGGQQTKGLALKGRDGRNYTFRGLDKDPSELLDEDLRGTIVDELLEDAQAAQHPASEVVARGLLDASGVPCPPWRLVVLPDDPALGAFRAEFGGTVGAFAEYPSAGSGSNPGFRGITEIIDHMALYERLRAGRGDRADVRALLRARLVDIFMGDWDRHRKQWRWARFPGNPLWVPIPEDRDQAFSRYEGLILDLVRRREPRLQSFGPRYAGIAGLTTNGREQDRQLLAGVSRDEFKAEATALRARLTDEAIDAAVGLMPSEWRAIDGPRLARDLKARRDALLEVADRFYAHLAERVDVYLTDGPERVEAERRMGGELELTARLLGAHGHEATAEYHRVFHDEETEEVRIYALGGDDRIVVTGGREGIKVRAVGGAGNDTLDDSRGGNTTLSDSEGANEVVLGPGTQEDGRPYRPPPPPKRAPWIPPQDFDSATWTSPWISYGSDLGVFLGAGVQHQGYGFRKNDFSRRQVVRAGYSFGEKSGRLEYTGIFHRENRPSFFGMHVYASGVEVLRFHGFGNETANTEGREFYKARQNQVLVHPSFTWPLARRASLSIGPVGRYSSPRRNGPTLVDTAPVYGRSDFGQVGARAGLVLDGRDNPQYPRRGGVLALRGTVWPEAWDVLGTYGAVDADGTGYLSAGQTLTLALRGGAKRVFGDYPYFDAASLGGGGLEARGLDEPGFTLRGFRARRFSGDASLYGNADLRLRLGKVTLILPCHIGVFGLFDAGRVWYSGEDSNTWHTAYGGGIWLSFLNYRNTLSAYVAHTKEANVFHVGGGFTF